MILIHSDQLIPKSFVRPAIFLAGPTARADRPVPSWRNDAIRILEHMGFDGTAFIPEFSSHVALVNYRDQVEWEWACLHASDVIVFWVPRDLEALPAFTTNVEFGYYIDKKPTVYGRPDESPKNAYLDWLYEKVTGKSPWSSLAHTLAAALELSRSSAAPSPSLPSA